MSVLGCMRPLISQLAHPARVHPFFRNYATQAPAFTIDRTSITLPALNAAFKHKWLRDACQCPECVHTSTRQKLHNTGDIPADTAPRDAGVRLTGEGLTVEWSTGHKSFYPTAFLEAYSSREKFSKFHKDLLPKMWTADTVSKSPDLFLPYSSLKNPAGLSRAMTQLTQYGLLFMSGVPNQETSDQTCELRVLANYFGEIRETFYGQLFDVQNVRNSTNIAYTNLDLGLHMDLLYFQHPPRYQILHCLRNRVVGGASIFVDALQAASELRHLRPHDFQSLVDTPVSFHYMNAGHHLHHEHRTIELSTTPPLNPSVQETPITHINYSPPFMGPGFADTPSAFYDAFKAFTQLLRRPQSTYTYTLKEGDAVLFDNRRVLHARTSFRDVEDGSAGTVKAGETSRWLKGCYLEADALLDRGRVLKGKLESGK